jgi:SAM-dependent methyltransferase
MKMTNDLKELEMKLLRSSQYYGQYLGIDILSRHIQWCKETLSPCAKKNSSIEFLHLDVKNNRYNPQGKLSTQDADFGLKPKSTDVILLTSVFTHMYEDEILEYLHKIKSSLAPEGRVLATAFLLNDSWAECEQAGLSAYPMPYELNEHCRYKDEKDPLHAIGYSQDWFCELIKKTGLKLESDPILGRWCGRKEGYRWQDILILSHDHD